MGAWNNDGLFWISPAGKVSLVNTVDNKTKMSHEEYAERKWGISLEDALAKRYIRVQSIPHQYLYVDHGQKNIRPAQQEPLASFFQKPYAQIVVERPPNKMENFKEGEQKKAFQFAVNGFIEENVPTNLGYNSANKTKHPTNKYYHPDDFANKHPSYLNRPGVNPIGDHYIGFQQWLSLKENGGLTGPGN